MADNISDAPPAEDTAPAPVRKRSRKGEGQSNAQRQKAFRDRRKALLSSLADDTKLLQIKAELTDALARLATAETRLDKLKRQLNQARSEITQLRAETGDASSSRQQPFHSPTPNGRNGPKDNGGNGKVV